MSKRRITIVLVTVFTACCASAATWQYKNRAGNYRDELLRLPVEVPEAPVKVLQNGEEIPAVVDTVEDERRLYVLTTVPNNTTNNYEVTGGKPGKFKAKVKVKDSWGRITLDNGKFAIRLPSKAPKDGTPPCPITALQVDGDWVGDGRWLTDVKLKSFKATIVDDGKVMGKVRLRYAFEGMAGLNDDIPAYAEVDVTVLPDRPFAIIEERHEMNRLSAWEFEPTVNWKATRGLRYRYNLERMPLKPGRIRYQPKELISNLVPRWNQNGARDTFFMSAADDENFVGALTILMGRWYWPHDNSIKCLVKDSADSMTFRCPTMRGIRYWLLVAGDPVIVTGKDIEEPDPRNKDKVRKRHVGGMQSFAMRHGYRSLDAIVHTMRVLDWDGVAGGVGIRWPFNHINPTSGRARIRGDKEEFYTKLGRPNNNHGRLTHIQSCLSPHTYGSYWGYSSPQNPNFFTDYLMHSVFAACSLNQHPRFKEIAKWVEERFREDMYHSVTLPGGAGNECVGYMSYAAGHGWQSMAPACKRWLGFDITEWPRWKAAGSFFYHVSQPWSDGKRGYHPAGDTHGGGHPHHDIRGSAEKQFGVKEDVKTFKTEELPNFGVIFRNKPGTKEETYMAFKSGPARGHFHGDQLSLHYCENSHPCIVDHHCSYGPRAGQEHMHNRVAFFTDEMPYGNMDGFERVIAFKPGEKISVAMGQVESWRLRNCVELPSENWHEEYPQVPFDKQLKYRRTIVHVVAEPRDYFVIRDQYEADRDLGAAFCLHPWDNKGLALAGTGEAAKNSEELKDASKNFVEAGVQPGWVVMIGRRSYDIREVKKNALTLSKGVPAGNKGATKHKYHVFKPLFERKDGLFSFDRVTVFCAKPKDFKFRFFPWCHWNHGQEATQGLRFEVKGETGEFITVIYPGKKAPEMKAVDGGVQVGDDVITFGGGIDDVDDTTYVAANAAGASAQLTGKDIDMDRSQGEIGLFVPDAGYPFGEIPKWLIKQRLKPPDWAPEWAKKLRSRRQ